MNKFYSLIVSASLLLVFAGTAQAHHGGPGFRCSTAKHAAEIVVCNSWKLSRLDRRLNYWYGRAKERARYFDQTGWLRSQQRAWLRSRNACYWNKPCITRKYRQRIRELRRYFTHV